MISIALGFVLAMALGGSILYVFYVWWQVRGLLGVLLVCLAVTAIVLLYAQVQIQTCIEYTDEGLLMYYSCGTRVPLLFLRHVRDAAILLIPAFLLLAHDAYIARHNSHRAVTTKAYQWFVGMQTERTRNGSKA